MAKAKTTKVWFVAGADPDLLIPVLFTSKLSAEKYARTVFPDEDADKRYARVYYREVLDLEDEKQYARVQWTQWTRPLELNEELVILLDEYLSKPKQYEFAPEKNTPEKE